MFRVIYTVSPELAKSEEEWLRSQFIIPTVKIDFDWSTFKQVARFGMIIPSEQLTMIKLRRTLDMQLPYSQK